MSKTLSERAALVSQVEDLMLRGITRPRSVARMVAGISPQTAKRYIALVTQGWRDRSGASNETHRTRLLAEAQEIYKRAFEVVARAANEEHPGPATFSAIATALGVALKATERQAKLLGLDSEKREHGYDPATLDVLRERLLLAPTGYDPGGDAIREMYGVAPDQGDSADESASNLPQRID